MVTTRPVSGLEDFAARTGEFVMRWTHPLEILLEIGIAIWFLEIFVKPIRRHNLSIEAVCGAPIPRISGVALPSDTLPPSR